MPSFRAAPSRKAGVGSPLLTSEAITARLEDLERKMERLRSLYESFFLGVERRPPQIPRQELNRLMLEMQQVLIRNAALRFRFQGLSQRWTLMTTYWNRTLREIESGTYRRDLQKAYRRIAARGEPLTEAEAAALGIPAARAKAFVSQQNQRWGTGAAPPSSTGGEVAPASSPVGVAASPRASSPAPATGPAAAAVIVAPRAPADTASDGLDVEGLHRAYANAHARLALSGTPPTADRLRAQVLPHLEKLRAAHPTARVEMEVVIRDGRVVIRAKPIT